MLFYCCNRLSSPNYWLLPLLTTVAIGAALTVHVRAHYTTEKRHTLCVSPSLACGMPKDDQGQPLSHSVQHNIPCCATPSQARHMCGYGVRCTTTSLPRYIATTTTLHLRMPLSLQADKKLLKKLRQPHLNHFDDTEIQIKTELKDANNSSKRSKHGEGASEQNSCGGYFGDDSRRSTNTHHTTMRISGTITE